MDVLNISENSNAEDLESLAFAIHALVGLPTTVRSVQKKGIRIEKGQVIDRDYTDPVLEEVLRTNKIVHTFPADGAYSGKPLVVSPLRTKDGKLIAAIGVVDIMALLELLYVSKN